MPAAVLEVVATLNVEVPEPLAATATEVGLIEQVILTGQFALTATTPLKELVDATVMVELPLPPAVRLSDAGLLDIEKSGTGAAFTVSETVVE